MDFHLKKLTQTGSTMDDAREAALSGAPDGTVIWALSQTGGRGRRGRSWVSPPGNLYASLLVRPDCSLQQASLFAFAIALAIHTTLASHLGERAQLKWPNDILIDGKKISGILLESDGTAGHCKWLVIGFGVNVETYPPETSYPATCLAESGLAAEKWTLDRLLDEILAAFSHWRGLLVRQGFPALRMAWLLHARGLGEPIIVRLPNEEIQGRFLDLDTSGNLRLQLPDGREKAIAAGDVYFHEQ